MGVLTSEVKQVCIHSMAFDHVYCELYVVLLAPECMRPYDPEALSKIATDHYESIEASECQA